MTAVLANVTIDYAKDGNVAFTPKQMAEVGFDPQAEALAEISMLLATAIDSDTVDVQYDASVTAANFLASDFLDNSGPSNPTVIAQNGADTIRLTGWNNPIAQNDILAYTGHATGIASPQTINIA